MSVASRPRPHPGGRTTNSPSKMQRRSSRCRVEGRYSASPVGMTSHSGGGKISVWNPQALSLLLEGVPSRRSPSPPPRSRPFTSPHPVDHRLAMRAITPGTRDEVRQARNRLQRMKEHQEKMQEYAEATQRAIKTYRDRREARFHKQMHTIESERETFVADVERFLEQREQADLRKRKKLNKTWNHKVYHPIQDQVRSQVDALPISVLSERRRHAFDQYIQASNQKTIFRDVVIENEYNPYEIKKHSIHYNTREIEAQDPLKKDLTKFAVEGMIRQGAKAPERNALGRARQRDILDMKLWNKLEATPYYDRLGEARPPKKMVAGRNNSHLKLDHYNIDTGIDVVKTEMPGGKKIIGRMQGSNIFPDVKESVTAA